MGAEYGQKLKKENEEDVGNHRPNCTLPALYKLFSTVLYNRLYPRLHQIQSEDQGTQTYRMIEQKCQEWCVNMWIATIDFMKAFDSINHNSIWDALKTCGIKYDYISLLKRLYKKPRSDCND